MEYVVDEDGVIHEDADATKAEHSSKASFKLDLIEFANSDPLLKPSDLKVLAAYAAVLDWPCRHAYLASTLGQAKTGLSDRQLRASRARLAGKNAAKRKYLHKVRIDASGVTVFRVENPWKKEDVDQHVAILLAHFKEQERDKKALQRQILQGRKVACPGTFSGDVPADISAIDPVYTPQDMAPKKENTVLDVNGQTYGQIPDIDPDEPFPIPETDEELASAIADFVMIGCSPVVVDYFRQELLAGRLTMNMVEEQRRLRAA